MSWKSKTELAQSFVSVKRTLDFVPHGQMKVVDSDLTGHTRFCKKMEGDYVTLISNLSLPTAEAINLGDTYIILNGWDSLIPNGALLSINASEFIVVLRSEYVRLSADPTVKLTYLHLEVPTIKSYNAGTSLIIVGFPAQLVGPYSSGASAVMYDTAEMSVPGDFLASFHYESDIPVLDAWQRVDSIQDKSYFKDESGNLIRRYYAILEKPLQHDFRVDTRVFLKALPAYQSDILPVDMNGAFHVDAFTGKTFGKGSDNLSLSVTLYNSNKEAIPGSKSRYNKNDVITLSSFSAIDYALWRVGAGTVVANARACSFILDSTGHFSIGNVFVKQLMVFRTKLTCTSAFKLRLRTLNQDTVFDGNGVVLELNEITDHIILDIVSTTPASRISIVNEDVATRVGYIDYSYCPDVNIAERWEGASLILKPSLDKLLDLYSNIDDMNLDSGVILA